MLPDRFDALPMPDSWKPDWSATSPMFSPLGDLAAQLAQHEWPDSAALNALADDCGRRVVNAGGQTVRFVVQGARPQVFEDRFEPRAFLRGEVQMRPRNWHDLFNALVWLRFPAAKAALNARQFSALSAQTGARRTAQGDALTTFDEDGIVVLSAEPQLLTLIREFRWKELFCANRESVRSRMRFLVFGHALYEKTLAPFVGMTAKAILLQVPEQILAMDRDSLLAESDRLTAAYLRQPENLTGGRSLAPLPVLGVPGWWGQNESEGFYDDTAYFRPGRGGAPPAQALSSSFS